MAARLQRRRYEIKNFPFIQQQLAMLRFPNDYDWQQPITTVHQALELFNYALTDTNSDLAARSRTHAAKFPVITSRDNSAIEFFNDPMVTEAELLFFERFVRDDFILNFLKPKSPLDTTDTNATLKAIGLWLLLESLEDNAADRAWQLVAAKQAAALLIANADQLETDPQFSTEKRLELLHALTPLTPLTGDQMIDVAQGFAATNFKTLQEIPLLPSPDDPTILEPRTSFYFQPPELPTDTKRPRPRIFGNLSNPQESRTTVYAYHEDGSFISSDQAEIAFLFTHPGPFYLVEDQFLPETIEAGSTIDPEALRRYSVQAIKDGRLIQNQNKVILKGHPTNPLAEHQSIHCHPARRTI